MYRREMPRVFSGDFRVHKRPLEGRLRHHCAGSYRGLRSVIMTERFKAAKEVVHAGGGESLRPQLIQPNDERTYESQTQTHQNGEASFQAIAQIEIMGELH